MSRQEQIWKSQYDYAVQILNRSSDYMHVDSLDSIMEFLDAVYVYFDYVSNFGQIRKEYPSQNYYKSESEKYWRFFQGWLNQDPKSQKWLLPFDPFDIEQDVFFEKYRDEIGAWLLAYLRYRDVYYDLRSQDLAYTYSEMYGYYLFVVRKKPKERKPLSLVELEVLYHQKALEKSQRLKVLFDAALKQGLNPSQVECEKLRLLLESR